MSICWLTLSAGASFGQNSLFKPQLWNGLNLGYNFNKVSIGGTFGYDYLFYSANEWNELYGSVNVGVDLNRNLGFGAGFQKSRAKQNEILSSVEYRPFVGVRLSTDRTRKFALLNRSRLEFRALKFNNDKTEKALRFRNRVLTYYTFNGANHMEDGSIIVLTFFEWFSNFEGNVTERFFKNYKIKLGTGYRLNYNWRFDLGVLFQESKDNAGTPVTLPTNVETRFILEWNVTYVIGRE